MSKMGQIRLCYDFLTSPFSFHRSSRHAGKFGCHGQCGQIQPFRRGGCQYVFMLLDFCPLCSSLVMLQWQLNCCPLTRTLPEALGTLAVMLQRLLIRYPLTLTSPEALGTLSTALRHDGDWWTRNDRRSYRQSARPMNKRITTSL